MKTREVPRTLSAGSVWDPIGPLNLQGRSKSVAINPKNPSTVYVGTASGGLWRSYTGGLGQDWEQVKLGHPALGISAIVIDPIDTNRMYLGTGEVYQYQNAVGGVVIRTTRGSYGIGILKTSDGGITWTKSLDWSYNSQSGIQAIKMNPLNHNTLWAATTEGIYKTTNAGETWEEMLWYWMAEDIVIHPTDTNKVLCTFGNFTTSVTFLTTDGGNIWDTSPLPSYSGKTTLDLYAAHPNVVYASAADSTTGRAALYRSTNFGGSWVKLKDYPMNNSFMGVQGWYSHFAIVHPMDSSIIIHNAVGRSKSTDGGITFFSVSTGYSDNHSFAIHPTNPNIIYVVNDDGVYRSTDFGGSYTNIGFGMQTGQFYNGFSCSATDSFLAIGQSQDHIPGFRYLGSPIWDHNSVVDEVGWTAINQSNDYIMYADNRFGGSISKSTDRGASFRPGSFGFGGIGAWNSPFVVSPSHPYILYFGDRIIYKSVTAAGSWSTTNFGVELDGNPALSMAISATNPDTVYVGMAPIFTYYTDVYRTTNGGVTWTNISGTLPNRYPMDMAVDPTDSRIVYIAMGGFDSGHLFKSTNAGINWTDISGSLPNAPTTAVIVDPLHPNVVYAGNDIGVYVSTNGGSTWSGFNEGLPDAVIVADLVISPSNRALRVATHGNGVWERKLLSDIPSNYFDYKVASLDIPVDGSRYMVNATISPIRASFRNISLQTGADSFNVKYRILKYSTEVYSSTKRISALGIAETRKVTFDGSFIPTDPGYYTLEAITLATDDDQNNDTLRGAMLILLRPSIQNYTVTKVYSPYSEISAGSDGPVGDDIQKKAPLPFTFRYDDNFYDSVQISTNGWLEFGAGTPGSLLGLSTDGQLGVYFREAALANTERPTKVLGAWWADLIADGYDQKISYTTIGSLPDRTFIVEWKNIPANYDPSTTTFINFQIKLHETSNIIEYSYGPKVSGSMPPSATGASIGFKDYIGGDYRYYDITRYGTGLESELRTDLSPLTDWPGADSCFRILPYTEGVGDKKQIPTTFMLSQNYPNPFNPTTTISFDIPVRSTVNLKVYDILGKEVMTLAEGNYEAGSYTIHADLANLASGMYLYSIKSGTFTDVKKMVLMR
jgi:photosystem II stability/assembly factor-like uncharacterized protein